MRANSLSLLSLLGCCIGAGLVFNNMTAQAAINCSVNCYNYTHFCEGGGETDDCTRYTLTQGHAVHSPSSSGVSSNPTGGIDGVRGYDWGAGLCDTGGGYGVYYEICACAGNMTVYPDVNRWLCQYGSSS